MMSLRNIASVSIILICAATLGLTMNGCSRGAYYPAWESYIQMDPDGISTSRSLELLTSLTIDSIPLEQISVGDSWIATQHYRSHQILTPNLPLAFLHIVNYSDIPLQVPMNGLSIGIGGHSPASAIEMEFGKDGISYSGQWLTIVDGGFTLRKYEHRFEVLESNDTLALKDTINVLWMFEWYLSMHSHFHESPTLDRGRYWIRFKYQSDLWESLRPPVWIGSVWSDTMFIEIY